MGKDVQLRTYVKTSKDSGYKEYANGSKIYFEPDGNTEIIIKGEYLGKYKISSEDDPNLSWLSRIDFKEPSVDFKVVASVTQEGKWYKISNHEKWKPIRVSLSADGQPLTDEQLMAADFTVSGADNLKYRCEPIFGESAYNIYLAQNELGEYAEPETGKYNLTFAATYTDKFGKETTKTDDASFEIQNYSKFWRYLFWVLIVLAIIIIVFMILNKPTLPSSVYLNTKKSSQPIKINGASMGLSTNLYPGEIKCEAKACTPLRIRGSTNARFEIKSLRPAGSVNWFEIDGYRFKKTGGKYVNDDGDTIEKVKPRIQVSDDTELRWNTNKHTVTGRIYINHND